MERVEQVKKITVLQSLRAARFEDVTILGSQYRDHTGASSWYIALWSERNIRVRIYRLSGGELPDHIDLADLEALRETVHLWERLPASRPS
jgi:hypothetical protein